MAHIHAYSKDGIQPNIRLKFISISFKSLFVSKYNLRIFVVRSVTIFVHKYHTQHSTPWSVSDREMKSRKVKIIEGNQLRKKKLWQIHERKKMFCLIYWIIFFLQNCWIRVFEKYIYLLHIIQYKYRTDVFFFQELSKIFSNASTSFAFKKYPPAVR